MKTLPNEPLRAVLLSPDRLRTELSTLVQRPIYEGYAVLTGLPNSAVQFFESGGVPQNSGLWLYQTPGGRACALLGIQAGPVLLRVLVALGTKEAREWLLEGLQRDYFLIALDVAETQQLVMVQAPVTSPPEALAFARTVEASPIWVTGTPDEFADLVVDVRRLTQSLLLRPAPSILRDFAVESSWLAVAIEMPLPIPAAPPSDGVH